MVDELLWPLLPHRNGPLLRRLNTYLRRWAGNKYRRRSRSYRRFWRWWNGILERAPTRFGTNPLRVRHRDELERVIAEVIAQFELDALVRELEAAHLAFGIMRSAGELVEHPQLRARDRLRTIGSPGGELLAILPPVIAPGREPAMGDVPALGQHDEAVRGWLAATARAGRVA